MDTRLMKPDTQGLALAAELLQKGEVVAIPTETVYGLAADATNGGAVGCIFAAKSRPQDNPLIVHIAGLDMLPGVAKLTPAAEKLAEAFWPGPLTMVLSRGETVANEVCAGLGTVGVRMPSHPDALAVIRAAGLPLAAPSANLSGSPSPTNAEHVRQDMSGRIPLILDGGSCEVGLESTVVSLVGEPTVLRPGFITPAQLEAVLGQPVAIAGEVTQPLAEGKAPPSPGMKYKHYAPCADIILVQGSLVAFTAYVEQHKGPGVFALCYEGEQSALPVPCVTYGSAEDEASQAAALFTALRELDERCAKTVYARVPSCKGIGLAVYNRLLRAAAFRLVKV